MRSYITLLSVTLKWTLRDKVLHALLGVALLFFFLVPFFSLFSMRQVQELSISLSLSAISFILLILTTVFGASSIWRDVERRYTVSVLGLPVSRVSYIIAKFLGIAAIILFCAILLGLLSVIIISISSVQYQEQIPMPIHWMNIFFSVASDSLKYMLLAAFALLFSSLSTSFFLPFFATIAVYIAGSASQEVYEYISGDFGKTISPLVRMAMKALYYLLPNFSAFNLKVQAIYGLPLSYAGLGYTLLYFLIYTGILLTCSIWIFSKRQLT